MSSRDDPSGPGPNARPDSPDCASPTLYRTQKAEVRAIFPGLSPHISPIITPSTLTIMPSPRLQTPTPSLAGTVWTNPSTTSLAQREESEDEPSPFHHDLEQVGNITPRVSSPPSAEAVVEATVEATVETPAHNPPDHSAPTSFPESTTYTPPSDYQNDSATNSPQDAHPSVHQPRFQVTGGPPPELADYVEDSRVLQRMKISWAGSLRLWQQACPKFEMLVNYQPFWTRLLRELRAYDEQLATGTVNVEMSRHELVADVVTRYYDRYFKTEPVEPIFSVFVASVVMGITNHWLHLNPGTSELSAHFAQRREEEAALQRQRTTRMHARYLLERQQDDAVRREGVMAELARMGENAPISPGVIAKAMEQGTMADRATLRECGLVPSQPASRDAATWAVRPQHSFSASLLPSAASTPQQFQARGPPAPNTNRYRWVEISAHNTVESGVQTINNAEAVADNTSIDGTDNVSSTNVSVNDVVNRPPHGDYRVPPLAAHSVGDSLIAELVRPVDPNHHSSADFADFDVTRDPLGLDTGSMRSSSRFSVRSGVAHPFQPSYSQSRESAAPPLTFMDQRAPGDLAIQGSAAPVEGTSSGAAPRVSSSDEEQNNIITLLDRSARAQSSSAPQIFKRGFFRKFQKFQWK